MDPYNIGYTDGMNKAPKRPAYTILDDDNHVKRCYLNGYYDGIKKSVEEWEDEDGLHVKVEFEDPVNHPSHYCKGGVECLDAIRSSMTDEMFCGFLKGNILKYIWRFEEKNKVEDLKKAEFYIKKLVDVYSEMVGWQDK